MIADPGRRLLPGLFVAIMILALAGCKNAGQRGDAPELSAEVERDRPLDPKDPWLFTDRAARSIYPRAALEKDLREEVMQGGPWERHELDYLREIRTLQKNGSVVSVGHWYVSPFPTIYRATKNGSIEIAGRQHRFVVGDDITFQCRISRAMNPELTGPLMIFGAESTSEFMLCQDMKRMMMKPQEAASRLSAEPKK